MNGSKRDSSQGKGLGVRLALGYSLLLAVLLFSLFFVRREMENLSASDNQQSLEADSLLLLLHEKDENTIRMLRVLNEAEESTFSPEEVEEIIAVQDTIVTQQRVQRRVITKRDSLLTKPPKKGFFRRLAEAFSPSKRDSAVLVNTSLEFATDTIIEAYSPVDSLQQKFRRVTEQKRVQPKRSVRPSDVQFRRLNKQLTARIDSLVKGYEQEVLVHARLEAEKGKEIRLRSTRIIGGIAVGAVLLAAVFLLLFWRDITRSNRYRRQLEEANRRAEELLEAREKLMLAITHDFKAPLGSIMGYTDLLARLTDDERQRFYLDNMKSSSAHLLKLVNDLLDFHRLDLNKAEVNRVTFNPAHLFEEIRVSFQPLTAAKGLAMECIVAPELDGRFVSDPLRIRQVVNNLLSNAVKFTSLGRVKLLVGYASSRMVIEVADTGKGMASGDRERIFQEFTRLPGAQGEEGFGLGLSIVSKLVSLLEGDIDVQSTLGQGSRFIVTLPLFPVGEAVRRPASSLRVLLIDDDRIQLTLTAAMLQQQGITAVCCQQLDELLGRLRTACFDLLLTDVQMPAINGFDLLKLLRASNIVQARSIPVFAVTARSEMSEQEFAAHGFSGCLHKPFTVAELLSLITAQPLPACSESAPPASLHFGALTAFSEDDSEAAAAIIRTFSEETQKNITRLEEAAEVGDVAEVVARAHQMLPLFTLIGATQVASLLSRLEDLRGEPSLSTQAKVLAAEAIPLLKEIAIQAASFS